VALAGGFGAAALLEALDAANHGGLGSAISGLVEWILGIPVVQQFLSNATFGLSGLVGSYLASCVHGACGALTTNPNLIVPYLLASYLSPENLVTAAAAAVLLVLGIQVVGALVAAPSPFSDRAAEKAASATVSVFGVAALSLVCGVVGLLVWIVFLHGAGIDVSHPQSLPPAAAAYVWAIGVAELGWFLGLVTGVLDGIQGRRWAWVLGLLASAALALLAPPVYGMAIAALALNGCLALGIAAARGGRWGWAASLGLVALLLAAALADLAWPHNTVTFGLLEILAPPLVYGIWVGPALQRTPAVESGPVRGALALAVGYLVVLVGLAAGVVSTAPETWVPLIALATFLGAGAWALSLADAVRAGRWGWATALVGLLVPLIVLSHAQVPGTKLIHISAPITFPLDPWLVWPVPFVVVALSYTLWAGPIGRAPAAAGKGSALASLPSGVRAGGAAVGVVVLVGALLALDVAPTVPIAEFPLPSAVSEPTLLAPGVFFPFAQPVQGAAVSQPHDIVAGPDGALWFTEFGGAKIGRMTTGGQLTEYPLPKPGSTLGDCPLADTAETDSKNIDIRPAGIAVGPDANLWFTQAQLDHTTGQVRGSAIGRVTTAGAVEECLLPASDGVPNEIVTGPDGALWFTAEGNIGRFTTDGEVTEYPLPSPGAIALGIVAGSDGNLWFADFVQDQGEIGRITPDGSIQEFPVPAANSQPTGMALGPDGNLWFTDDGTGQIGRVTPSGTITMYPVPVAGAVPFGIAKGPDGNLWFAEIQLAPSHQVIGSQIGRITPSGSFRMFPLSLAFAEPLGIAAGPDGNLWITEAGTDRIGRLATWLADLGIGVG
jgi:streptogramin lyase